MISRTCLLFLPMFVLAQKASPELDEQLRARVTGFYSNFVEGAFSPRKAETFVAEDTKDYFYNTGKLKFVSFKIDSVEFDDSLAKAKVLVTGKTMKMVLGHVVMMDMPMITRWKIEDGKWVWTFDGSDLAATPMGGSINPANAQPAKSVAVVPKDTSPEAIKTAGLAEISKAPMGINKADVTMRADEPGSIEIVFTNGADGPVEIGLDGPAVRGLTTTFDRTSVPGHGTAVLKLKFDPADKSGASDIWSPKGKIPYRLVVSPFSRMYAINLMFIGTN